jgi:hypothetical protein
MANSGVHDVGAWADTDKAKTIGSSPVFIQTWYRSKRDSEAAPGPAMEAKRSEAPRERKLATFAD